MNKKMGFSSVAFIIALLQGCSAHVSGGDQGGNTPPQNTFQNLVDGPSLDGTWKSACMQSDRNYGEYQIITLTVGGQNIRENRQLTSIQRARNKIPQQRSPRPVYFDITHRAQAETMGLSINSIWQGFLLA